MPDGGFLEERLDARRLCRALTRETAKCTTSAHDVMLRHE